MKKRASISVCVPEAQNSGNLALYKRELNALAPGLFSKV